MKHPLYSVFLLLTVLYLYPNVVSAVPARRSKYLRCGSHNLPPGEYWISSPRCMKKAYNCQYSIKVSPKNSINIACPRFSSLSRWCTQNHLQIHVWKYCGRNTPKDFSRRGDLKIIAFSRDHPEKIKYLCQIVVSLGQRAVSISTPVASTSISTATTALTQAPTTATSVTAPETTAAATSTIVAEISASEITLSSTAAPSLTTVPETTAAPTSSIVPEASTSDTTVISTGTHSSTVAPEITPCSCGLTNRRLVRIIGGEAAEKYEFPWQAAVVRTGFSIPLCYATILNSLYLITLRHPMHPIDRPALFEILLHKHKLYDDNEQMLVKIQSVVQHPKKRIDLLKLRTPIKFPSDNSVAPICLPPEDGADYVGEQAIVAGWGWTKNRYAPDVYAEVLMKMSVIVGSEKDCTSWSKPDIPFNMAQEVCTKPVDGKGACRDSGAPLIVAGKDGAYSIIGVNEISNCGGGKGKYIRITPLLSWIQEQIADGDFCANQ